MAESDSPQNQSQSLEVSQLQHIEYLLKNLRVADLEMFISACRMQSLGKAAKMHHLSQSATSTAIQRVETAFCQKLCTHERRQFRLTREGRILLPKLEKIVQQIRDLIVNDDQTPIRIAMTHAIAQIAVLGLMDLDKIEYKQMRPDQAYAALLRSELDVALVLDNSPWKGVIAAEVGQGFFQLYSRKKNAPLKPILLPEDQMEVLFLKQTWLQVHKYALPVKTRIPSWSLIGQILSTTDEVGFLPDFIAKKYQLHPVLWQPSPSPYRILALYQNKGELHEKRIKEIIKALYVHFNQ